MLCGRMPADDGQAGKKSREEEALRFLRFWLGSIAVHARRRGDASLPPIVLVGTHGDQVRQPRGPRCLRQSTRFARFAPSC